MLVIIITYRDFDSRLKELQHISAGVRPLKPKLRSLTGANDAVNQNRPRATDFSCRRLQTGLASIDDGGDVLDCSTFD